MSEQNAKWSDWAECTWTRAADRSVLDSDGDVFAVQNGEVRWRSRFSDRDVWLVWPEPVLDHSTLAARVRAAILALHGPEPTPVVDPPPAPGPVPANPPEETWTDAGGYIWRRGPIMPEVINPGGARFAQSALRCGPVVVRNVGGGTETISPGCAAWCEVSAVMDALWPESVQAAAPAKVRQYDGWTLTANGRAMLHRCRPPWAPEADTGDERDAILAYLQGKPGPWTAHGAPTFVDSTGMHWTAGRAPNEVCWHNDMEPSWQYFRAGRGRAEYDQDGMWLSDTEPLTDISEALAHFWPSVTTPSEGRKDDSEKNRVDLLPFDALEEVAQIMTYGARKYADRNWERGMSWSRPFGALMRHMWAWWRGEAADPETGRSHLAHAACCVLFLLTYELRQVGTDDRPTRPRP